MCVVEDEIFASCTKSDRERQCESEGGAGRKFTHNHTPTTPLTARHGIINSVISLASYGAARGQRKTFARHRTTAGGANGKVGELELLGRGQKRHTHTHKTDHRSAPGHGMKSYGKFALKDMP